jgi:hypothetical protein
MISVKLRFDTWILSVYLFCNHKQDGNNRNELLT